MIANLTHVIQSARPYRLMFSLLFMGAVSIVLTGCTGSGKASPEDLETARERARSQALELVTLTDTMLMESMLIDVRERETYLRNHNMSDVADTYVETFLSTLDSVSPSIASELR